MGCNLMCDANSLESEHPFKKYELLSKTKNNKHLYKIRNNREGKMLFLLCENGQNVSNDRTYLLYGKKALKHVNIL